MRNSQLSQRLQHLLCASTITVLSPLNDSAKFIPLINFGFSITSQVKETNFEKLLNLIMLKALKSKNHQKITQKMNQLIITVNLVN